jgi:hypothetical protein
MSVGGWVGYWLGADFGLMTRFLLSMVGTGVGLYLVLRFEQAYRN